jgi:hypothetical protein
MPVATGEPWVAVAEAEPWMAVAVEVVVEAVATGSERRAVPGPTWAADCRWRPAGR